MHLIAMSIAGFAAFLKHHTKIHSGRYQSHHEAHLASILNMKFAIGQVDVTVLLLVHLLPLKKRPFKGFKALKGPQGFLVD